MQDGLAAGAMKTEHVMGSLVGFCAPRLAEMAPCGAAGLRRVDASGVV